jgi:hypothetical protein
MAETEVHEHESMWLSLGLTCGLGVSRTLDD